jgi:UDP-N-acetylglucosamine diphosphorylase/glucosamine-1-phosphate N-acetyltransferase
LSGFLLYMTIILFDDNSRYNLLPFTHTRPVADIRCGILTMRERWEYFLKTATSTLTENYLQELSPLQASDDNLLINSAVFADAALAEAVMKLPTDSRLVNNNTLIAARISHIPTWEQRDAYFNTIDIHSYANSVYILQNKWDIFSYNDSAIKDDYALLTTGRTSEPIPADIIVRGKEQIFIEPGATLQPGSILNATTGPIYIGKDAEVWEGCMLRGPVALCTHAVVKMGAKIYGATTIGPGSKVGGEISNTVFFDNSNKGHDGFVGNAVIGAWCNLGADTNASNLKNNYDVVKVWNEEKAELEKTGLTFCGLLMGDHSKCGINTMFNTGTVVGVSANVFGSGFPDKFIPSFSWGGCEGMETYALDKAMETAQRMMARRKIELTDTEKKMYEYIYHKTAVQRTLNNDTTQQ